MGTRRSPQYQHAKRVILVIANIVMALFLVLLFSWWFLNHHFNGQVEAQYTNVAQRALKTTVPPAARQDLQTSHDRWQWAFTDHSRQVWQHFTTDWAKRQERAKLVTELYADKDHYQDGVTSARLNTIDQTLLQEKNSTVYQDQKNRLDTVQVWFQQTTDANAFIQKIYSDYTATKVVPTLQQVAQTKAYYSLIRNRTIADRWRQPVQNLAAAFDKNTSATNAAQSAAEQKALDELKNAPLTQGYTPAQVTISQGGETLAGNSGTNYDSILSNADITATSVLLVDQSAKTAQFLHRSSGHYSTTGDAITLDNLSLSGGQYSVSAMISGGAQGAVVTAPSASDFGQYYAQASAAPSTSPVADSANSNDTSDFNDASTVFWLRNNTDLQNSILLKGQTTIGFIAAGASTLGNMISTSNGYTTIANQITSSTVVYVY